MNSYYNCIAIVLQGLYYTYKQVSMKHHYTISGMVAVWRRYSSGIDGIKITIVRKYNNYLGGVYFSNIEEYIIAVRGVYL